MSIKQQREAMTQKHTQT